MNSTNNNLTAATVDTIVQEYYANYIHTLLLFSSTILPFYAALLRLSQEIEHIWFKPFSFPTWLYIFARYGNLVQQGLNLSINFALSKRTCNILAIVARYVQLLAAFGVQGLLIARAYALCQSKVSTIALAFGFLASWILVLCGTIIFPGCSTIVTSFPSMLHAYEIWAHCKRILMLANAIIGFSADICLIFTDILVFGICMWKVWGTWKLKCEAGIQSTHSLVSVFIRQSILRCCFVIVITVVDDILIELQSSSVFLEILTPGFNLYQNSLSSILVTDFTLDLRSLNSAKIEASNVSLPPLQFSNVLQHVHQSLTVELATPDPENINVGNDHDNPEPESMEDSDIQLAQD